MEVLIGPAVLPEAPEPWSEYKTTAFNFMNSPCIVIAFSSSQNDTAGQASSGTRQIRGVRQNSLVTPPVGFSLLDMTASQ